MKASGAQLAKIIGVSPARISQLKADGIIATDSGAKFDVPKSVQAYIAFLETGALSPEIAAARSKLIEQQTRRLRLANDRTEKTLVSADDVQQVWMASMAIVIGALESIPGRLSATLAAETDTAKIHAHLKSEIRDARQAMADKFGEFAEQLEAAARAQS